MREERSNATASGSAGLLRPQPTHNGHDQTARGIRTATPLLGGPETSRWKRIRKRPAIRVSILENHPLAAARLRGILRHSGTSEVLIAGRDGKKPRSGTDRSLVVVIDRDTLVEPLDERLHSLQSEVPRAKALVIGRSVPCEEICRLLFSGARGFVPYPEVQRRLVSAIRAVSDGHLWVEPEALQEYTERAARLWADERHDECKFTPTERRVLGLLQLRLSNKEIAAKMEIGERTVKFHLGNIFSKAGIHDRYSLIDLFRTGGLDGLAVAGRHEMRTEDRRMA